MEENGEKTSVIIFVRGVRVNGTVLSVITSSTIALPRDSRAVCEL